jgi:hypothetical protein
MVDQQGGQVRLSQHYERSAIMRDRWPLVRRWLNRYAAASEVLSSAGGRPDVEAQAEAQVWALREMKVARENLRRLYWLATPVPGVITEVK